MPLLHEELREKYTWTSFGKNGKEPAHDILLKDISNAHIINIIHHLDGCIEEVERISNNRENSILSSFNDTKAIMEHEIRYRKDNNIFVPDYFKFGR